MYLEFFHLKEFPFSLTPDPKFLYFGTGCQNACEHLLYGITNRKGFIALTGECGCGKSTILRAVIGQLGDDTKTALILNPVLNGPQLLRAIVEDFGIPVTKTDRFSLMQSLNDFLLEQAANDVNAVLFIDEAQDLPVKTLEEVRLLSNLETADRKLLQIVLAGQQELNDRLNNPALRQLRQRITVRYHIAPMGAEDVGPYIAHRLRTAGAPAELQFTDEAVAKITRYSRGIPRLVNAICDYALMAGFAENTFAIDTRCVDRAEYQLEGRVS